MPPIQIEVFGGARCAWVASCLQMDARRCWVFSIVSDERIPAKLEQRLSHTDAFSIPSHLVILGDFIDVPPECGSASYEVIRLIAEASGGEGVIKVCWLDLGLSEMSSAEQLNLSWYEVHLADQRRTLTTWPVVSPVIVEEKEICREIYGRLGVRFGIRLAKNGHVESLNLTDGAPYRRSLMFNFSRAKQEEVLSLIFQLEGLRELNLGFAGLGVALDLSRLRSIESLDVRGNPGLRLENISMASFLRKVNLAACEIRDISPEVGNLSRLEVLLLHKNRIDEISSVRFPKSIRRLSLYRNNISSGVIDLTRCRQLSELNVGANPIETVTVRMSPAQRNVVVSSRHVLVPENILLEYVDS